MDDPYWFAVGEITEEAEKVIRTAGGLIRQVNDDPCILLVSLEGIELWGEDEIYIQNTAQRLFHLRTVCVDDAKLMTVEEGQGRFPSIFSARE